ncbi:MAG: hypothetical protein LAO24_22615 [Acidobacteriia bacterium]|nr:hypothetical protein [Terriglobia bacterium]
MPNFTLAPKSASLHDGAVGIERVAAGVVEFGPVALQIPADLSTSESHFARGAEAGAQKNVPPKDRVGGAECRAARVVKSAPPAIEISADLGLCQQHSALGVKTSAQEDRSPHDRALGYDRMGPATLQVEPRNHQLTQLSVAD